MRGGKRPRGRQGGGRGRGGTGGGGPSKKPKRSKNFWKQRKTIEVAPVPKDDSDISSSEGDDNEDAAKTHYDQLLTIFSSGKDKQAVVSSEEESGDDDDDDEEVDEEEDGAEGESDVDEVEAEDLGEEEEEVEEEEGDDEEASGEDEEVGDEEGSDEEPDNNDLEVLSEESSDNEEEETGNGRSGNEDTMPVNDQTGGPRDPFVARYELKIPDSLRQVVQDRQMETEVTKSRKLGRLVYIRPRWTPESSSSQSKQTSSVNISEEEDFPEIREGQIKLITKPLTFETYDNLEHHFVKAQLARNVSAVNMRHLPSGATQPLTHFQSEIFSIVNSYKDLNFNQRTHENGEQIRLVYTLHALNHILKTRTKIINNNAKLSNVAKETAEKGSKKKNLTSEVGINVRDQGLVRPKIVILVPFRESARRVVDLMSRLLFSKDSNRGTVMKKSRFDEEFGHEPEVATSGPKPDDFYQTFAGNTDDGFKMGIAVTKKAIKLYSDFYSSDILLASPLGLRMVLEKDSDFLSSVELLILDQVDIFAMQNWDHVTLLMDKLHIRPSKSHGVDFTRVRLWTLDELSPLYRQTLIFSSNPMAEVNAIFNRACNNFLGKVTTVNPVKTGSISGVVISGIPIIFHRVDTASPAASIDDRFNYFVRKVMPEYKKDIMYHTLIFVPSYFDFVRLRNWFTKSDLDFSEICEYTKDKRIAEYRDLFFHGEKHFLLYTERAHFFRRFTIKGIRHLIFYQLPQNPEFFSELCNLMQPAFLNRKGGSDGNMTCTVLYTKYDNLRLASACSSKKADFMLQAEKNVHLFMPGQTS